MTIKQALQQARQALEAADVPDPRLDAELLLAHVVDMRRLDMLLCGTQPLTHEQEQRFASLLLSRAGREPLQYLLGEQGFYGLTLRVDSRALIPRQETETLCELGVNHLRTLAPPARALDLCTGSGALAAALKRECPAAEVHAADLSEAALALARENAALCGAEIAFHQGDLFAPLGNFRFDLILSNPPYIPTAECAALQPEVLAEPVMALDGGADGLDFYRRIAAEGARRLTPRGLLAVEVGDRQANAVAELFRGGGLRGVAIHSDLYGAPRVVCGRAADFT